MYVQVTSALRSFTPSFQPIDDLLKHLGNLSVMVYNSAEDDSRKYQENI